MVYSQDGTFAREEEANHVEQVCEDVGYHGHEEHELGELV
jgi:hypothetical protein